MEKFFIYSHILCGVTVLMLGLISIIRKKGTKSHILIGRIYIGAMWWIVVSALSIILFYRFSLFLMVIAVITFHASFSGIRVMRRRKPGSEKWYDWATSVITGLFGVGLFAYAITIFQQNQVLAILSAVFATAAFNGGLQDILFFMKPHKAEEKRWWLYQHIGAMGGSYIAAVTAFAVQNGEVFGMTDHNWLLWVLPGILGTPIIALAIRSRKKRYAADIT